MYPLNYDVAKTFTDDKERRIQRLLLEHEIRQNTKPNFVKHQLASAKHVFDILSQRRRLRRT